MQKDVGAALDDLGMKLIYWQESHCGSLPAPAGRVDNIITELILDSEDGTHGYEPARSCMPVPFSV